MFESIVGCLENKNKIFNKERRCRAAGMMTNDRLQ